MTSIPPHWLRPALLFFLYIFAIPPGWFGRIRKPLHSKPHNTSINPSITNPNSEPLNSSEAFSQPRASVPVSLGLWDTALKFLSPGPRNDVTDHLVNTSSPAKNVYACSAKKWHVIDFGQCHWLRGKNARGMLLR